MSEVEVVVTGLIPDDPDAWEHNQRMMREASERSRALAGPDGRVTLKIPAGSFYLGGEPVPLQGVHLIQGAGARNTIIGDIRRVGRVRRLWLTVRARARRRHG